MVRDKETNLEVLRNFTDETLEGELADEELRRLLVPTDLTESDGTRPEAMGLLDTAGRGLCVAKGWQGAHRRVEGGSLTGAVLRAALAASCLRGALPPVDLRAVCLVRAIAVVDREVSGVRERRGL